MILLRCGIQKIKEQANTTTTTRVTRETDSWRTNCWWPNERMLEGHEMGEGDHEV